MKDCVGIIKYKNSHMFEATLDSGHMHMSTLDFDNILGLEEYVIYHNEYIEWAVLLSSETGKIMATYNKKDGFRDV